MTYSAPSAAPHSFRPYQPTVTPASTLPASSRHSYYPTAYEYDAPQQQQPAVSYRRRSDDAMHYSGKHALSAPASSASSTASSFSPLSLCSSVSSCSSSSSGSSSSAYSSPADTFDLEEMDEDPHHPYYHHPAPPHHRQHKQPPPPPPAHIKPGRPHPSQVHHQPPHDGAYYAPQAAAVAGSPHHVYSHAPSPPAMSVSIPAANGGWKDGSGAVRRRDGHIPPPPPSHTLVSAEPPSYLPAPMPAVVASVSDVADGGKASTGGKKKKGRSLRRCMDREKHSKAEQKRRGEMKVLFDQLQDISQCVYKDRIHILTLAIQTITRQQETIGQLEAQVKQGRAKVKAVKKEAAIAEAGASVAPSTCSTPSSNTEDSVGSKRAAVAAELDCEPVTVKTEEECAASAQHNSPKKQRTSPHPREVVDLSSEAVVFPSLPTVSQHEQAQSSTVSSLATIQYVSKPLHNSFSSSSLSTFVCPSGDASGSYSYLMDEHHSVEQPHGPYVSQHAEDAVNNNKSQLASSHSHHSTSTPYTAQPCVSPVFSFTAHPQHWWPAAAEPTKQ